jgi:putative effector of murein hydrolase LrgA (UPF0299 family)
MCDVGVLYTVPLFWLVKNLVSSFLNHSLNRFSKQIEELRNFLVFHFIPISVKVVQNYFWFSQIET